MTDTTPRAPQPVDDADTPVEVEAALADPGHTYPVDTSGLLRARPVSAGSPAARLRNALAAHPPTGRLDIRYAQTSAADPLDDLAAVLEAVEGVALVAADAVGASQTLHVTTVRAELAPAVLPSGAAAREAQRAAQSAALSAELGIAPEFPALAAMHQAVDAEHLLRAGSDTTPLGALIDALAAASAVAGEFAPVLYAGAGRDGQTPNHIDSWRGVYADLALGHDELTTADRFPTSLRVLRNGLEAAVGHTFYGWKGGEYTMTRATPVWCDNRGQWTDVGIVGVDASPGNVVIALRKRGDS